MIKEIVTDPFILSRKSVLATPEDVSVITDLVDTLVHNKERCVGMAANMIGVLKQIVVIMPQKTPTVLVNPKITETRKPYETEEGCLSLTGVRKTTRYETIRVEYLNEKFQPRRKLFSGWEAQIIQHEIDHINGILI